MRVRAASIAAPLAATLVAITSGQPLAVASCHKTKIHNLPLWEQMLDHLSISRTAHEEPALPPEVRRDAAFLFLGDAFYAKEGGGAQAIRDEGKKLKSLPGYRAILNRADVYATWDDHDAACNDFTGAASDRCGGSSLGERRRAFFEAMYPEGDPRAIEDAQPLYFDRVLAMNQSMVHLVVLDTRSHADDRAVANFDGRWFIAPIVNALGRLYAALSGRAAVHEGDLLGPDQWQWLEDTLSSSQADFTLIASTVQVHSTNPVTEGWGHYPKALRRLHKVLARTRPRGLAFLSGDVHYADMWATLNTWEVTTSGVTHTCANTAASATGLGFLCSAALGMFQRPLAQWSPNYEVVLGAGTESLPAIERNVLLVSTEFDATTTYAPQIRNRGHFPGGIPTMSLKLTGDNGEIATLRVAAEPFEPPGDAAVDEFLAAFGRPRVVTLLFYVLAACSPILVLLLPCQRNCVRRRYRNWLYAREKRV